MEATYVCLLTAIDTTLGVEGAAQESVERVRRVAAEKNIGYRVILMNFESSFMRFELFIKLMPCVLYPLTQKKCIHLVGSWH